MRLSSTRTRVIAVAALTIAVAPVAVLGATLIGHDFKTEHWGIVPRNIIGSPVAELRDGPYGSIGHTGAAAEPPFGKGSLGVYVANGTEKVDFGNEVDFFGDPLLALNAVGFHVFQTGENITAGGPGNLPNIRLEIDPNSPGDTNNYSTMVWVPVRLRSSQMNGVGTSTPRRRALGTSPALLTFRRAPKPHHAHSRPR